MPDLCYWGIPWLNKRTVCQTFRSKVLPKRRYRPMGYGSAPRDAGVERAADGDAHGVCAQQPRSSTFKPGCKACRSWLCDVDGRGIEIVCCQRCRYPLPRSACETPKRSTSVAHRVAAVAGSRPLNRVGRDACDNTRGPAGGASCPTPAAPFSGLATYPVFSRCAASVAGLIQEQAAGWGRRGAPRRPQTIDQPSITSASTGIGLIASNEVAGRGRRYRFLSGGPTCSNSIILA